MNCSRCGLEVLAGEAFFDGQFGVTLHNTGTCIERLKQRVHDVQPAMIQVADFGGKASVEMSERIAALEAENAALREQVDRIETDNAERLEAVENHAAMGHDRCHENDVELYAAFGIAQDLSLPPKEKWLGECERYWECRKSGVKDWPSVTELQGEAATLREDKVRLVAALERCETHFGDPAKGALIGIRAAIYAARKGRDDEAQGD